MLKIASFWLMSLVWLLVSTQPSHAITLNEYSDFDAIDKKLETEQYEVAESYADTLVGFALNNMDFSKLHEASIRLVMANLGTGKYDNADKFLYTMGNDPDLNPVDRARYYLLSAQLNRLKGNDTEGRKFFALFCSQGLSCEPNDYRYLRSALIRVIEIGRPPAAVEAARLRTVAERAQIEEERKEEDAKIEEEKRQAQLKIEMEKRAADEKLAMEKRLANEKLAEERHRQEQAVREGRQWTLFYLLSGALVVLIGGYFIMRAFGAKVSFSEWFRAFYWLSRACIAITFALWIWSASETLLSFIVLPDWLRHSLAELLNRASQAVEKSSQESAN